jgi:hypothetical protein
VRIGEHVRQAHPAKVVSAISVMGPGRRVHLQNGQRLAVAHQHRRGIPLEQQEVLLGLVPGGVLAAARAEGGFDIADQGSGLDGRSSRVALVRARSEGTRILSWDPREVSKMTGRSDQGGCSSRSRMNRISSPASRASSATSTAPHPCSIASHRCARWGRSGCSGPAA